MEKDNQSKFYDGSKLLSMKDAEGLDPELYITCSSTRGVGKSWWFTNKLIGDFLEDPVHNKFVLLARHKLELGSVASGIMKSALAVYFPEYTISETLQMKGSFSNIYLTRGIGDDAEKLHAGYCIALASSDLIKKSSSLFYDACQGWYDEFMPENKSSFIANETERFCSIAESLSRGEKGKSRRRFPWYFTSNTISINNPYFIEIGLSRRIQSGTKFVRGTGYVFQRIESTEIAQEHAEAGINRAFQGNKAISYKTYDDSWMNDNYALIESVPKGWGRCDLYCNLVNGKYTYGVKFYPEMRLYYVDYKPDKTSALTFNIKYDDLKPNIPLIRSSLALITLKNAMEQGIVRFKDIRCKEACMDLFI